MGNAEHASGQPKTAAWESPSTEAKGVVVNDRSENNQIRLLFKSYESYTIFANNLCTFSI